MSKTTEQRPPHVTMAAGVVIVGSVFLLLTVWQQIATLRSLQTREAIEDFLAEPLADGLGLDVESVISILHGSALVTAGCAAASIVLGWHVLHRHHGARLGLTILAVPMFVAGLASGGVVSSFVAVAPVVLWLSPAREWFRTGRWTLPVPPVDESVSRRPNPFASHSGADRPLDRPVDRPVDHQTEQSTDHLVDPPAENSYGQPVGQPVGQPANHPQPGPAENPYGQPVSQSAGQPASQPAGQPQRDPAENPYGNPYAPPAAGLSGAQQPGKDARPGTVTAAGWITMVLSGVSTVLWGLTALTFFVARDQVIQEMAKQPEFEELNVDLEAMSGIAAVLMVALTVWSVASLVLGIFVLRRSNVARILLVISSAVVALLALLSILSGFSALWLIAAIAVIVLLFVGGANAWFDRRGPIASGRPHEGDVHPRQ